MEPKGATTYEFKLEGFEDLGGGDMPPVKQEQEAPERVPAYQELLIEHGRVEALKAYIMASWDCVDAETCLNILGFSMLDED